MIQLIVIALVVIVGVAYVFEARRRAQQPSPNSLASPARPPSERMADEELPTETGRYRVKTIVEKVQAEHSRTAHTDQATEPALGESDDDIALPDPFDENNK